MNEVLYAVYGVSGYGREVMPLARMQLQSAGVSRDQLVFVDDNTTVEFVNGQRVWSYEHFLTLEAKRRFAVLAIANSGIRQKLAMRMIDDDVLPWTVQASNVTILDDVNIGEGAILNPFVALTSNVRIGRHFHANLYSYVAHDCLIGDFVTFAPAVKCNGNVIVEDHAYIGAGAVIKQGAPGNPLVIGKGAVVGMGAVVTRSVAPGTTVVGNPARPVIKS